MTLLTVFIFEGQGNHVQIIINVCFYLLRKASHIMEITKTGLEKTVMFSEFKLGTFGDVFLLNSTHN